MAQAIVNVSVSLFFFRNLPFLTQVYHTQLGSVACAEMIAQNALNELRSVHRAFTVFTTPSASFVYQGHKSSFEIDFGVDRKEYRIRLSETLIDRIQEIIRNGGVAPLGDALYVPAERVLYAYMHTLNHGVL